MTTGGVSVQGEHIGEDLLALGNIFHGCIVDAGGLCNRHLLWTTGWTSDAALGGILLWRGALSSEVARATTVEASVAGGGPSGQWCSRRITGGGEGRALGAAHWC
jgi:hypothetical protein